MASGKTSIGILDKGKSILSKERAKDWNTDDRVKDGYMDTLIPKKNLSPTEKGYDTDYTSTSKTAITRIPKQHPLKVKILRKTNGSINGQPVYRELSKKIINSSTSTVELSDGKTIRKSDIAIPKSKPTNIRFFGGNIFFPHFPNPHVEVGRKRENSRRQTKTR